MQITIHVFIEVVYCYTSTIPYVHALLEVCLPKDYVHHQIYPTTDLGDAPHVMLKEIFISHFEQTSA